MQHARMFSGGGNSGSGSGSTKNRLLLRQLEQSSSSSSSSNPNNNLKMGTTLLSRSSIENTIVIGRRKDNIANIRSSDGNVTTMTIQRNITPQGQVGGGAVGGGAAGGGAAGGSGGTGSGGSGFGAAHNTILTPNSNNTESRSVDPIPITVWFHDIRTSSEDIVLDSKSIPGIQDGDLCELVPFHKHGERRKRRLVFIAKSKNVDSPTGDLNSPDSADLSASQSGSGGSNPSTPIISANAGMAGAGMAGAGGTPGSATPITGGSGISGINVKSNFQISLLANPLQKLMDLPPRLLAHIQIVDVASVEADTVEIFIKDVSLSRDAMWTFSLQLTGTCVYHDKRLDYLNSRCGVVKCIYKNGKKLFSGYISSNTNVIFRSESSKLVFLVQISREMWHFEETGEILFHKLVNTLFPKIFQKWRDQNTHHSITIVLFTSVDLTSVPWTSLGQGDRPSGRRDFFRVVVDQVNIFHWDRIMANLRVEFANFKQDIMLKQRQTSNGKNYVLEGDSLPSVKGNLLEAINVGITLVSDRFQNTDLKHSLNHFVVVTPGTGLFDVDYNLMVETSRKMLSIDAALDIVCLSQPPLHIVPLFRYKDPTKNKGGVSHCVPNWCDISFFKDLSLNTSQWIPRCKIYELQMMGVMENEVNELEIERFQFVKGAKTVLDAMDTYDRDVFKSISKVPSQPLSETDTTKSKGQPSSLKKLVAELNKDDTELLQLDLPKSRTKEADTASINSTSLLGFTSLSLIWNNKNKSTMRSTSATKTDVSTTAVGTVTKPSSRSGDSTALNTLYSLRNSNPDHSHSAAPYSNVSSPTSMLSPVTSIHSVIGKRSFTPIPKSSREYLSQPRMISKDEIYTTELERELGTSPKNESRLQRKQSMAGSQISNTMSGGGSGSGIGIGGNGGPNTGLPVIPGARAPKSTPTDLLWTVVPNPSKEIHTDILDFLRLSRWNGVFPPKIKRRQVKWRSFQSPAALPIITKVFPTAKELELNYTFQLYDVVLSPENDLYLETTKDLFREMIQLRLVLGFQICYGDGVKLAEQERINGGNPECLIKYLNPMDSKSSYGSTIYLSLDDEIHRINFDFNGNLNVQLYRHDKKRSSNPAMATLGTINYSIKPYDPLIRTRYADEYTPPRIDAIKTQPKKYNWNQFDQVLAGFDDAMADSEKSFHRMKFVVMPADLPKNAFYISNEKLSDEEIRMEGLRKLIAMIERGKYVKGSNKFNRKKEEILPEISFYTGNLYEYLLDTDPTHVNPPPTDDGKKKKSYIKKDIDLKALAQDLQGTLGLKLVDRTWHFKVHPHCFLGNELVSWLIENFQDIDSREEGTHFGQELMKLGLFNHVEHRHGLLDGYYFYEFEEEYRELYKVKRGGWFQRSGSTNTAASLASNDTEKESINKKESIDSDSIPSSPAAPGSLGSVIGNCQPKKFTLSSSVEYNVDSLKKSYKPEVVTVHYDTVHNPEHCYHIRLQWLNNTTKFIDETINNWSRFCERHGLKLVETPWDELCTIPEVNPFHSIVDLSLELNPWVDEEFANCGILEENKFYFHFYLLSISGFLLDNRSPSFLSKGDIEIEYSWGKPVFKYAQYIHRTGTYIVELRDNGDLYLAPNNVHLTRQRTMLGAIPDNDINLKLYTHDAQKVMLDFRTTCTNKSKLREIFTQAKSDWTNTKQAATNL